jgi:hypothetical protein
MSFALRIVTDATVAKKNFTFQRDVRAHWFGGLPFVGGVFVMEAPESTPTSGFMANVKAGLKAMVPVWGVSRRGFSAAAAQAMKDGSMVTVHYDGKKTRVFAGAAPI